MKDFWEPRITRINAEEDQSSKVPSFKNSKVPKLREIPRNPRLKKFMIIRKLPLDEKDNCPRILVGILVKMSSEAISNKSS